VPVDDHRRIVGSLLSPFARDQAPRDRLTGVSEHEPDDEGTGEPEDEVPSWFETSPKTTCPACGAFGAMTLGEGIFCPSCGEITTTRPPQA
jgi:hypothetical protein